MKPPQFAVKPPQCVDFIVKPTQCVDFTAKPPQCVDFIVKPPQCVDSISQPPRCGVFTPRSNYVEAFLPDAIVTTTPCHQHQQHRFRKGHTQLPAPAEVAALDNRRLCVVVEHQGMGESQALAGAAETRHFGLSSLWPWLLSNPILTDTDKELAAVGKRGRLSPSPAASYYFED